MVELGAARDARIANSVIAAVAGRVGMRDGTGIADGERAVNDADVGDGSIAEDGIEEGLLASVEGDGVISAVERAPEVADGSPYSGHSQVGCEAVDAVGDGLQGSRTRDGGQGVAGVAGRVAVQVGLCRVGDEAAVVGVIAGAIVVIIVIAGVAVAVAIVIVLMAVSDDAAVVVDGAVGVDVGDGIVVIIQVAGIAGAVGVVIVLISVSDDAAVVVGGAIGVEVGDVIVVIIVIAGVAEGIAVMVILLAVDVVGAVVSEVEAAVAVTVLIQRTKEWEVVASTKGPDVDIPVAVCGRALAGRAGVGRALELGEGARVRAFAGDALAAVCSDKRAAASCIRPDEAVAAAGTGGVRVVNDAVFGAD